MLRAAILCLLAGPVQDARAAWKEKASAVRPEWGRKDLEAFLEGIRVPSPHRPAFLNGGGFSVAGGPLTFFDVHSLDETYALYVVWKTENPAQGIRSTEVVGLPDLKDRIDAPLFDAVAAIHRSPSAQQGLSFASVPLIRAVNLLQPLGKEKALQALWAYYRLVRKATPEEAHRYGLDEYRILPILQLLFDGMPGYRLGAGDVDVEFPVVLVQDVPFLLVSGYMLAGRPPDAADQLKRVPETLRSSPLSPKVTPLEAADELIRSPVWKTLKLGAGSEGRKRWQIRRQGLGAASAVFALRPEETTNDCCVDPSETQWRAAVDRAKAAGIVWSPEIQDFILGR